MRGRTGCPTIGCMESGSHTVVIDLESSSSPPSGLISVDGGPRRTFYGWIHLMSQLEELMPDAGVEGGVDQIGDRVQDHDEERAVQGHGHERREIQLPE
jgi:hypothetical protein